MAKSKAISGVPMLPYLISYKRELYCMSYDELGSAMGVKRRTVFNRMNKPNSFTLEELMAISRKLKIRIDVTPDGVDISEAVANAK